MGKAVVSYIYKILRTTCNTYIHFWSLLMKNTWTVSFDCYWWVILDIYPKNTSRIWLLFKFYIFRIKSDLNFIGQLFKPQIWRNGRTHTQDCFILKYFPKGRTHTHTHTHIHTQNCFILKYFPKGRTHTQTHTHDCFILKYFPNRHTHTWLFYSQILSKTRKLMTSLRISQEARDSSAIRILLKKSDA